MPRYALVDLRGYTTARGVIPLSRAFLSPACLPIQVLCSTAAVDACARARVTSHFCTTCDFPRLSFSVRASPFTSLRVLFLSFSRHLYLLAPSFSFQLGSFIVLSFLPFPREKLAPSFRAVGETPAAAAK